MEAAARFQATYQQESTDAALARKLAGLPPLTATNADTARRNNRNTSSSSSSSAVQPISSSALGNRGSTSSSSSSTSLNTSSTDVTGRPSSSTASSSAGSYTSPITASNSDRTVICTRALIQQQGHLLVVQVARHQPTPGTRLTGFIFGSYLTSGDIRVIPGPSSSSRSTVESLAQQPGVAVVVARYPKTAREMKGKGPAYERGHFQDR